MQHSIRLAVLALVSSLVAASCGGGGSEESGAGLTDSQRAAAATDTARNNPLCAADRLGSYYWEIGNKDGALASGSIGPGNIGADTAMDIASASKWPFAAYVVEKYANWRNYLPYLHFTSGYSNFSNAVCQNDDTVAQCMNGGINSAEEAAGTFHYEGGHMQQLGIDLGLGQMHADNLANEVSGTLGVPFQYVSAQPPGGIHTSARTYATFLRRLLVDSRSPLQLGPLLGSSAVCTDPEHCNASTDNTFISEPFDYSLGHWVENIATTTPASNFAYSSAGAFGFYPWVDFDRKLYGIVARQNYNLAVRQGYSSLECGRLLRLAWKTGTTQ